METETNGGLLHAETEPKKNDMVDDADKTGNADMADGTEVAVQADEAERMDESGKPLHTESSAGADGTVKTDCSEKPMPFEKMKKHRANKTDVRLRKKRHWAAYLAALLGLLVLLGGTWCGLNFFVDPYGVFGDRIYHWDAYSMTRNPIVGKMEYLQAHAELYNGYIFGTDGYAGYPVEQLNQELSASFFDMSAADTGMADVLASAEYVLNHYNCDYLILEVSPRDACSWQTDPELARYLQTDSAINGACMKYLFAAPEQAFDKLRAVSDRNNPFCSAVQFDAKTGAAINAEADIAKIGSTRKYMSDNGSKFRTMRSRKMKYTNDLTVQVSEIAALCRDNMVDLYVVVPPMYQNEAKAYDEGELNHFYDFLSKVTDYYDFGYSNTDIHFDARYFYDNTHYRRALGETMISAIFGGDQAYIPDGFGSYIALGTAGETHYSQQLDTTAIAWEYEINVPVIRYSTITQEQTNDENAVTTAQFADQIKAISEAGYTAVLYKDLISFVNGGMILPEKPVVIAFDGGYSSTLSLACPILAAYRQCASVAVVGSEIGKNTKQNTDIAMPAHFTLYEAKDYIEAGVLELQSNTYNLPDSSANTKADKAAATPLHGENEDAEGEDEAALETPRQGALRMAQEDYLAYRTAMENDHQRINELIHSSVGTEVRAVTYPGGRYDALSEYELHRLGVSVTVTQESGTNCLIRGLEQSLYALHSTDGSGIKDGVTLVKMLEMLNS